MPPDSITTALAPCPFCGSQPEPAPQAAYVTEQFSIWCEDCGADGPQRDVKAEAASAWNRRAPAPSATPELVQALEAASEALEPFAEHAAFYDRTALEDGHVPACSQTGFDGVERFVSLGDFRRARAAHETIIGALRATAGEGGGAPSQLIRGQSQETRSHQAEAPYSEAPPPLEGAEPSTAAGLEHPFVSECCEGELCMCGRPAVRKLAEVIQHDDPLPIRHELTAYVCAEHFIMVMGKRTGLEPLISAAQGQEGALREEEITPEAVAAHIQPDLFTPVVKRMADELYERLMNNVQDYLQENGAYNLQSRLNSAERARVEALGLRTTAEAALSAEIAAHKETQASLNACNAALAEGKAS